MAVSSLDALLYDGDDMLMPCMWLGQGVCMCMGSNSCHLAWRESWCSGVTRSTRKMLFELNVDSVCAVSASLKEVRMGAVAGEESYLGLA